MPAPIPELGNLAPTPKPQSATSTPTPKPGAFNKAETEDQKPEEDQKKGDGKEQSDDLIKEFMKKLSELIAFIMQASKGEEQQNEQKKQEEEQFSPQNLLKMLGKITAALDKSKDQEKDFSEKMNIDSFSSTLKNIEENLKDLNSKMDSMNKDKGQDDKSSMDKLKDDPNLLKDNKDLLNNAKELGDNKFLDNKSASLKEAGNDLQSTADQGLSASSNLNSLPKLTMPAGGIGGGGGGG